MPKNRYAPAAPRSDDRHASRGGLPTPVGAQHRVRRAPRCLRAQAGTSQGCPSAPADRRRRVLVLPTVSGTGRNGCQTFRDLEVDKSKADSTRIRGRLRRMRDNYFDDGRGLRH